MRSTRLMAPLAVVLAASAMTFTTGAASAPPAPPANNCTVAQSQRVGAWACTDLALSKAQMEKNIKASAAHPPTQSAQNLTLKPTNQVYTPSAAPAALAGDGVVGWCSQAGCWYLQHYDGSNDYHASLFDSTGFYGYGTHTIGSMTIHVVDYLPNSTQVKMVTLHSTAGAATSYAVVWSSMMQVVTSASGIFCGTSLQSANTPKSAGVAFHFDGAYLNQCGYTTQATQHTFYWRDYNYPGRWYEYNKSARLNHELGYQSHYLGDWDTPSAPTNNAGSGWQNL